MATGFRSIHAIKALRVPYPTSISISFPIHRWSLSEKLWDSLAIMVSLGVELMREEGLTPFLSNMPFVNNCNNSSDGFNCLRTVVEIVEIIL
jgi:hypothetical protein